MHLYKSGLRVGCSPSHGLECSGTRYALLLREAYNLAEFLWRSCRLFLQKRAKTGASSASPVVCLGTDDVPPDVK